MITFNLPAEIEQDLRARFPDLERHILENYAVEAYLRRELGTFQVRKLLGFECRMQAINFLSERGVYPNYDVEELEEDIATNERLFGDRKSKRAST